MEEALQSAEVGQSGLESAGSAPQAYGDDLEELKLWRLNCSRRWKSRTL